MLGRKLSWIKAAMEQASGKYEAALADYKSCLNHCRSPDHLEETRDSSSTLSDSGTSSSVGSPKHIIDGLQKLALLSRHDNTKTNRLALNTDQTCTWIM